MEAAEAGHMAIVQALLKAGADTSNCATLTVINTHTLILDTQITNFLPCVNAVRQRCGVCSDRGGEGSHRVIP
jgi:ankyrin repeat protein